MATHRGTRGLDLPANWNLLRRAVIARDKTCRFLDGGIPCGKPGTDIDHIHHRNDHQLDNLQLLCREHHQWKTSHHAGVASINKTPRRKRPPMRHPGLLPPKEKP